MIPAEKKGDITHQFRCTVCGAELKKEEKDDAAQPLCHACKVCHNHTKGCTVDLQYPWKESCHPPQIQDELLGLILDNDTPADEITVITSEDDTIVIDQIKR